MSKKLFGSVAKTFDASKTIINQSSSPKKLGKLEDLVFGKTFSNHMVTCEWTSEHGWATPEIKPYAPLVLDPAACVFHYSFECFEGLKAFKDKSGQLRMFRPERNMMRLNASSDRICLPTFDVEEGVKLLQKYVAVERDMVPDQPGYALYLRPTMIGTQSTLGVSAPHSAMLFVIASPVGPYYPTGFKAVRLEATEDAVRAWPGGVGNRKLGANYAPCIKPQLEASGRGFQQNLWLFEGNVTEVGTMNLFMAFENEDGTKELTTHPLDGTILEGITRFSIMDLARQRLGPEWKVTERKVHIDELAERSKNGQLLEIFGAGTAAVVSPVKEISYKGDSITVPLQEGKECGPLTEKVSQWIQDIQYGVDEHEFCKPF